MVTSIKTLDLTWAVTGLPGVYHLYNGLGQSRPVPVCGGERVSSTVNRPDGQTYCRYCIVQEGAL